MPLQDSLQSTSQVVQAVLPEDHVISRQIKRLAEANLSQKTRQSLREKEELVQVAAFDTLPLLDLWISHMRPNEPSHENSRPHVPSFP